MMISSGDALAVADQEMEFADKVKSYISHCKDVAKDGLSVDEFSELACSLLRLTVSALDSISAGGEQKKAWAVAAVGSLFDAVADKCVPLYFVPFWVASRPAVRAIVILAAGGVVQSLLPIVRAAK